MLCVVTYTVTRREESCLSACVVIKRDRNSKRSGHTVFVMGLPRREKNFISIRSGKVENSRILQRKMKKNEKKMKENAKKTRARIIIAHRRHPKRYSRCVLKFKTSKNSYLIVWMA